MLCRFHIAAPAWRAKRTHCSREISRTGTKGITSAAPMRGWTPRCEVRLMSSAARPAPRTADSTTAAGGPTMVTTERLWSGSREKSRSETPSTAIAATIASTMAGSRPSEKLGTHSMSGEGMVIQGTGIREQGLAFDDYRSLGDYLPVQWLKTD